MVQTEFSVVAMRVLNKENTS